jgi:hypothetical protein
MQTQHKYSNPSAYHIRSSLTFGFHACEREVGEALLAGTAGFKPSENDFDWLGHGMYFWENNLTRAQEYANELAVKRKKLKDPFVVGAVIKLGYCLDFTDAFSLNLLKSEYAEMARMFELSGLLMPTNEAIHKSDTDFLYRKLDCAVIQFMHNAMEEAQQLGYDSVRGVFWEGSELYPTSGFKEKNHVQLCVRNPNAIKGYFRPLEIDPAYPLV